MKNPSSKNIILASNSPRRRMLLNYICNDFELAPSREVDETYPAELPSDEVAPFLSRKKAEAYRDLLTDDNLIITADTVVILDGKILGKPANGDEAMQMLGRLNGRSHSVITGVTLMSKEKTKTFAVLSKVTFDNMTTDELLDYISEYRPFDKAGSYGVQEWIGARGIKHIEGCYYNIMGLPLNALYNELKTF